MNAYRYFQDLTRKKRRKHARQWCNGKGRKTVRVRRHFNRLRATVDWERVAPSQGGAILWGGRAGK